MNNPPWYLTVEELQNILSKYPSNALVELDSLGGEWSSAELTIYDPKTKITEIIMGNEN